jgi:hypothetical protein
MENRFFCGRLLKTLIIQKVLRRLKLFSFVADRLFEDLFFFEFNFLIFLKAVSVQEEEVKLVNIKLKSSWLFLHFSMSPEMNVRLFSVR